jgi:predicted PurR-regulated permease PerM
MTDVNHSRSYMMGFFVVAAITVGWICYKILIPFLAAIAWAIILAVAFQAPWRWLERRMPKRRSLAAGLLTLATALLVLLPVAFFVGVVATQAVEAGSRVMAKLSEREVSSFGDLVRLPAVAKALDTLTERSGISSEEFQKMAGSLVSRASGALAALSGKLVVGLFNTILTFIMTIFLVFFFFRDGSAMASGLLGILPVAAADRDSFGQSLRSMLQAIFRGSLLCALVQGMTGALGWWIAGLPSPALAGAAMAGLSLLPVGGTALVWLPGVVWLWTGDHRGMAVFLFVWGIVVTSFLADNVLRPLLIRGGEQLSTLVVFLGVFGGLAAFGLLGIFIGPVALALAVSLLGLMRKQAGLAATAGG